MVIENNIARIRAFRAHKGWSILRFAKEAGIGESTIRRMESPEWRPNSATIARLEAVIPVGFPATSSNSGGAR